MLQWLIWFVPMIQKIKLNHQQENAVFRLRTGSILWGGVGSGKSIASLVYYNKNEAPKRLYIITTANKRDKGDWEKEYEQFALQDVVVDSWNNIKKYIDVKGAFFIFDEQKVVGSGAWVKSFIKITKTNNWILLSATPGDTWLDYVPVFIANGYYKNRTEFIRRHVVYNNFTKFPKVDHYVDILHLEVLKGRILIKMDKPKGKNIYSSDVLVPFDKEKLDMVVNDRWNPITNEPIKTISEYCYTLRRVVNSDTRRLEKIKELARKHRRAIIFYNFNYELDLLRTIGDLEEFVIAEYNGHNHEEVPKGEHWLYLVQYMAGAEGWNCIETNTIIFYSLNYSYKITTQAAGRIDRLNSPFANLYYYYLKSDSRIDNTIRSTLLEKRTFNEKEFAQSLNLPLASES
jgi:hypothetical protein